MDAQVFWDELGTSSCWHGVTSVVMGNCGFTLAPVRPNEQALVVRNLERAEDISAEAMAEGLNWTWATFAEYLDAVDAVPKGINYAGSIGHSALRTWAMGERAFVEPANDDDLQTMQRELLDALRAGAVGFTTSRVSGHATSDGRPVASRLAAWEEVRALVNLVGRHSGGVFEITPADDTDPSALVEFPKRLQDLALESGVPITFGVFCTPNSPGMLPLIEDTVAQGGHMYGLAHCRGVCVLQSFKTRLAFDVLAEWHDVRSKSLDEQSRLLRDPQVRARLVDAAYHGNYGQALGAEAPRPNFDTLEIMYSPYLPNPTVGDVARERGVDPVELIIDEALEHNFDLFFVHQLTRQSDERLIPLLRNPNVAMTFSDSGAHVSQIADASIQTHLLAYWVRERQAVTLEEAIPMITHRPATLWRLHDRGLLREGYAADITIFNPESVAPDMPRVVTDLPGGARRLIQTAQGYKATIVNGRVLMRDGQPTEARPGQLLRAGQLRIP
jgi:N-acyl-D-amino-acid deacylase